MIDPQAFRPPPAVRKIEIFYCLFCDHHRISHGPEGCDLCPCPKKNYKGRKGSRGRPKEKLA